MDRTNDVMAPAASGGDAPVGQERRHAWDPIDFRILEQLERDGRLTVAAVSREVGRTSNSVRYRLLDLRKRGVVRRFRVHVEPAKLGPCEARLVLARGVPERAWTRLRSHPAVGLLLPTAGTWDAALLAAVPDAQGLRDFLGELKELGIEETEVHHVRSDAEMPLTAALCQALQAAPAPGDSAAEEPTTGAAAPGR